jgi:VPDSG-CTERM motif
MRIPKAKSLTVVLLAIASFALQQAKADFMSTLTNGNDDLSGHPGPFGTVLVSLTGQTATITFTAASGFAFVDGQAADVQISSTDFTADPLSVSPNTVAEPFTGFDSGQVDGFGTFNLRVNYHDASVPLFTISFDVTNNSSTLWTNASQVLGDNGSGFDAAAHILVLNSGGVTGKAAEVAGTGHTVPDSGATAMLLGIALTAAGVVRRFAII